jgi:hypothetical protein
MVKLVKPTVAGFVGIDPGKLGGIAFVPADLVHVSEVQAHPFANLTLTEIGILLDMWSDRTLKAHLEKVHSFKGEGVVSSFSFGRNYGQWEGLLTLRMSWENVQPKAWQKVMGVKFPQGASRPAKKRILKGRAQQIYPKMDVALSVADALLIATALRKTEMLDGHSVDP